MKLKATKKSDNITIVFGEWFDKSAGNTYYDAQVYIGDKVHHVPYQYGYNAGDQQSIDEALEACGYRARSNKRDRFAPYHLITSTSSAGIVGSDDYTTICERGCPFRRNCKEYTTLVFRGVCDKIRQTDEGEKFWQAMMKGRIEIDEEAFLYCVDPSAILDTGETWAQYKSTSEDMRFFKSGDIRFFQTAGFEFIWVRMVKPGDIRKTNESGMQIKIIKVEGDSVQYKTLDPIAAGFREAWTKLAHIINTSTEVA